MTEITTNGVGGMKSCPEPEVLSLAGVLTLRNSLICLNINGTGGPGERILKYCKLYFLNYFKTTFRVIQLDQSVSKYRQNFRRQTLFCGVSSINGMEITQILM